MAKGAYIGVNNVARKIKKGYIGVGGVARKIKKAYIGIGGVARPCWSGGELAYYGTITPLSIPRRDVSAASTANHAIFLCGVSSDLACTRVDAYNASLTRSTMETGAHHAAAATTLNGKAIFAGGRRYYRGSITASDTITMFNSSLTITTSWFDDTISDMGAASIGNHALFAGGFSGGSNLSCWNVVRVIDDSLTIKSNLPLSYEIGGMKGASNSKYAIFAGGQYRYDHINHVNAYDASLTHTHSFSLAGGKISGLSEPMWDHAAATAGDHVLFGGGGDWSDAVSVVNSYDSSLTRGIPTGLSQIRTSPTATSVEGFALFAGGALGGSGQSNVVDVYDASLVKSVGTPLSVGRCKLTSTTIGNYALFAGGCTEDEVSAIYDTVDVYTV